MKPFSNGIFIILLLALVLPFGGKYLQAQADTEKQSSQPESQSSSFVADSNFEGLFLLMDADEDGFITQDEWQRIFANHDENGDNRLSKKEIESIPVNGEDKLDPNQDRLAAFDRLDVNRNDAIDAQEWPGKDEDFDFLDADQNGSLSREEFLSRNSRHWNQPFENLDFNSNGIIDRSEWLDSDKSFDKLDRDSNGVVERREYYNPR